MKDLVEVIAKALVEHPDDITVTERQEGRITKVDLLLDPSDMGKVIGRQGRIAKAIRAVVKAAAARADVIVDVNIDANETGEEASDTEEPATAADAEQDA